METLNRVEILCFNMGNTKFGLDMGGIQEILEMIEITPLPDSPDFVDGVINLRGKIIPIIDLRKICNIESKEEDITELNIIVVRMEKLVAGMIVDRVEEVLKINSTLIEIPSEELPITRLLSSVAKLEKGIVFILDLNKIFDFQKKSLLTKVNREKIKIQEKKEVEPTPIVKFILHQRATNLAETKETGREKKNTEQLLSFSLGEEQYGLRVKFIKEILYFSSITKVPFAPRCIRGIINLRGEIVAIIDISKMLDLPESENYSKKSHIIVIEAYKKLAGFWVNKIGDIGDFSSSAIVPPLSTLEKNKADFIEGEIEFENDNKLVTVLKLENILNYKME